MSSSSPASLAAAAGFSAVSWPRGDGQSVPGYAIGPADARFAVVALQEWWGVDYEILEHAKKIAAQGYRVVVPDLYRGKLGLDREEAAHLMGALDFPGAVADVIGASAFLRASGAAKVAVTGFCMGGALATLAASASAESFAATAPFYGVPGADFSKIAVPFIGHFGALDSHAGFSDPATVDAAEATLKASGVAFEMHRYPGVGHAFMNATAEGIARREAMGPPAGHDAAAVALAWERTFAFFAKYLV